MKGPGYPAFLALGNWLGISVSMATALFHCLAITLLIVICHRFVKSIVLSGLMFTLLLWHPVSLSVNLLRLFRDAIYYAQGLLFLAFFIAALFFAGTRNQRWIYAALSGAAFGWFWLTREESI